MRSELLSIIAAAGDGTSRFGGDGGGGGSFGGGGGFDFNSNRSGGGSGGPGGTVATVVTLVVILAILGWILITTVTGSLRRKARHRARVRRVELAAAEAAEDDPDFDPDTVRRAAAELFLEVQRRWSENDIDGLRELVSPELMIEWSRRLRDFERRRWRNKVEPRGEPEVEYVGLVNREGEDDDRVVVHITCKLDDYVVDERGKVVTRKDTQRKRVTLRQWWTLQPPGDRWRLVSIEQDAEGVHHLDADVVPTPWSDRRVADEALVETAVAGKVPAGAAVKDIAPAYLADDARSVALDLSLADARFSPDLLEVAARRAVEAWMEAVDGEDEDLEALAEPAAVDVLLYGGTPRGRTRVVVRGADMQTVRIDEIDPHSDPPAMTVEVDLEATWYVENRDTAAVVSGDRGRRRELKQRWRFVLTDDEDVPWRLATVVRA